MKAAGVAIRAPGGWGRAKPANESITDPGDGSEPKPANESITDSGRVPARASAGRSSACVAFDSVIVEALSRGRNAMGIYQDLVSDHGFAGSYGSVMRYVQKLRRSQPVEARVVIQTEAGQEWQVDYGDGPMVRDPQTGKYRRTRLFILTLGYSRKAGRFLTWRSSTRIWAELHERAFRRLGGAPRVIVLDNLREGVVRPDVYEPELNPLYADVLRHYGVVALPCRVRDPDRKGKVESAIGHTQRTPLRGQRFESLDEAQAYLDRWERQWADTRIHGTTKRQVSAMFDEEKPALLPLPIEPFRYYQHGNRAVHLDGHVEIGGAYYSVPPGMIGQRVPVSGTSSTSASWTPKAGDYCASTSSKYQVDTARRKKTSHRARRKRRSNCWLVRRMPDVTSEMYAVRSIVRMESSVYAGSLASWLSQKSMVLLA